MLLVGRFFTLSSGSGLHFIGFGILNLYIILFMTLEKASKETLRFLFSEYLKGPAVIYTINNVAKRFDVDVVELSDYLLDNSFIRERWVYPGNIVACRITIKGIEEIDPVYVRDKLRQVIGGLGDAGGIKELIDILSYKIEEYSIALDIVKQLENLGFVKIRHPKSSIIVELTEEGRKYYEKGSRTFFTLMSY